MRDINKFLHVIAIHDFVAGHEVLEDRWREWKNIPEKREESFILKALINGSTALALKAMGKHAPALQVWETFLKYEPLIETLNCADSLLYEEARIRLHVEYKKLF
ncbi:MAG: DUF309 domain-containing protein [Sulfurospirillum sp.]|nr:DUF309 domain-containing protein [Sulfurospirillum sp.]